MWPHHASENPAVHEGMTSLALTGLSARVLTCELQPDTFPSAWLHKDPLSLCAACVEPSLTLQTLLLPDVLAEIWLHEDQLRTEALPNVARHCRADAKLARHICDTNSFTHWSFCGSDCTPRGGGHSRA